MHTKMVVLGIVVLGCLDIWAPRPLHLPTHIKVSRRRNAIGTPLLCWIVSPPEWLKDNNVCTICTVTLKISASSFLPPCPLHQNSSICKNHLKHQPSESSVHVRLGFLLLFPSSAISSTPSTSTWLPAAAGILRWCFARLTSSCASCRLL